MTDAQITQLTKVLEQLAENQSLQLKALQGIGDMLAFVQHALDELASIIGAHDITDKEREQVVSRIRTAISLDNPQLWHDALASTLATLGLPKGG